MNTTASIAQNADCATLIVIISYQTKRSVCASILHVGLCYVTIFMASITTLVLNLSATTAIPAGGVLLYTSIHVKCVHVATYVYHIKVTLHSFEVFVHVREKLVDGFLWFRQCGHYRDHPYMHMQLRPSIRVSLGFVMCINGYI